MSGTMKSNYKDYESAGSQSGTSMKFWGISCVSGKIYKQVVGQRFRLTMAVLDPKSFDEDSGDKIVSLSVIQNDKEFLLCILKHGEIHQVNLNLIFDKGDNVVFYISGSGTVHLSGYQMTDSLDDDLNDENGNSCPVTEEGIRKEKDFKKAISTKAETVTPKSKKKALLQDLSPDRSYNMLKTQIKNDNVFDEDDDDEDFQIDDLDDESSSDIDDSYEEDEADILKEFDDEMDEDNFEDEEELISESSKGSQKRKHEKMLQPQKRRKGEHLNNSVENSDDVICIKDDTDEDVMNSSIGNTPMPKQQANAQVASSEKKKKKKKRLSEISNLSDKAGKNEGEQFKSPVVPSTPKLKGDSKGKHPIMNLNGGVEIQDILVGRGPVATKGKTVSVFYVGRLEDKKIFDSRVPPKKPFTFRLGVPEVIKGLDFGIQGMRVGGQRKIKIPPSMGYGNSSGLEQVPPNSTLYFSVELQSVS